MKRAFAVVITLTLVLFELGCSPVEQQARDTAAALGGMLAVAQTQNQTVCTATPTAPVCTTINKAISAQNALVTAVETYCGWSTTTPPGDANAKCVPVKTAEAGLQSAISNAQVFVTELKGVVK